MTLNKGTLVPSTIRTIDSNNTYPVAINNEIRGGLHTYNTLTDRNNIPLGRRTWGMLCYVTSETNETNNGFYFLRYNESNPNIMDNSNWTKLNPDTSSYETISLASALNLITTNSVIPNNLYIIEDVDVDLYGGTKIFMRGLQSNLIDSRGFGEFYNPKYQQSASGYGIFDDTIVYNTGEPTIWGGKHWINVSGNTGNSINSFQLSNDWEEVPYNTNDYNVVYNEIFFDWTNLIITERKENDNIIKTSYENIVYWENLFDSINNNPIKAFQWGNYFNSTFKIGIGTIDVKNSYFETINFKGKYIYNVYMDSNAWQRNLLFDGSSYQDGISLTKGSYQDNVSVTINSYQSYISLDNGSYQSDITITDNSYQENISLNTTSYQSDITINDHSYQKVISFDSGSYQSDITINDHSYQSFFSFNVGSYQDDISLTMGSYQTEMTLNNRSLQSFVIIQNASFQRLLLFSNSSSQSGLLLQDFSEQSVITIDNTSSQVVSISNNSRQTEVSIYNASTQNVQIFDVSEQNAILIDNKSYQSNIRIYNGSQQQNIIIDNFSYQDNILIDNNSSQTGVSLKNFSFQENITIDISSTQENISLNNQSNQMGVTLSNTSSQKYFQFENQSSQSNAEIDNYSIQSHLSFDSNSTQTQFMMYNNTSQLNLYLLDTQKNYLNTIFATYDSNSKYIGGLLTSTISSYILATDNNGKLINIEFSSNDSNRPIYIIYDGLTGNDQLTLGNTHSIGLPNIINSGTIGSSNQIPVITYDNKGRIISTTTSNIILNSNVIYDGLTGSSILNIGSTFSISLPNIITASTIGTSVSIPIITYDNKGRIISTTTSNIILNSNVIYDGLSGDSTLNIGETFSIGLPNITIQSSVGSSNEIPIINYDDKGRITSTNVYTIDEISTTNFDGLSGDSTINYGKTFSIGLPDIISASTVGSSDKIPVMVFDSKGRVINAAMTDIKETFISYNGLTGSSTLNIGETFSISLPDIISASTVGSSNQIPVITYDNKGRIISTTTSNISLSSDVIYDGLTGSNILNIGETFSISLPNIITASTIGSSVSIPIITYDNKGRIISTENTDIYFNSKRFTSREDLPEININSNKLIDFLDDYFYPERNPDFSLIYDTESIYREYGDTSIISVTYTVIKKTYGIFKIQYGSTIIIPDISISSDDSIYNTIYTDVFTFSAATAGTYINLVADNNSNQIFNNINVSYNKAIYSGTISSTSSINSNFIQTTYSDYKITDILSYNLNDVIPYSIDNGAYFYVAIPSELTATKSPVFIVDDFYDTDWSVIKINNTLNRFGFDVGDYDVWYSNNKIYTNYFSFKVT